ncbi:M48 family metalloprotease [Microvirga sp. STS02]|uniref:M56 family metallopeptidase n=1 Tax=Hymenobacter negativus TaxID=2795026 RepID=UPI0018DDB1CC|nr:MULTISPECIES: M56 family metallopeptidase [Bacteria]MBH8570352.1 M48 family metalloprotease [Hymenobacter negativus]MBR7210091.1 M48 family metalloprotease [Microvirga sp. STS02]
MNQLSLLNWMLLSTALLAAWWTCYRLALRPERSFAYNRAFLVLGPLLAAGLPLVPLAWPAGWWGTGPAGLVGVAAVLLPAVEVGPAGVGAVATGPDWTDWLLIIYLAGAALMLVRLAYGLGRLWRTAHRLPRTAHAGYTLVETHGQLPASSFGRVVFWDETLALSPAEARQVLRHELAHVRQGHTYDRLLLELLRAALWFNPFAHLCGRALALTHEYLADEAALHDDSSLTPSLSTSYSQLLARQVASRLGFSVPLAHSFSHSQTLSRIAMIQKTNPIRRWKQWLALPLAGILVVAVACEKAAPPAAPAVSNASTDAQVAPPPPPKLVSNDSHLAPPPAPAVYTYVEQMPELVGGGGNRAIVDFIQNHLKYPANLPTAERVDGTVFVQFIVNEKGIVEPETVHLVKGLTAPYNTAVVQAVLQLPRFTPGMQRVPAENGPKKPVAVSFTVPIRFAWKNTVGFSKPVLINWQGWVMPSSGTGC